MIFLLQLVHISKIIRNFAVEKVMMSENKRNLTEKEEYYKLITDEKSNHIGTNANGAGSQCVRRKNIGSLSFRERYLSLRQQAQMGIRRVPIFYFCSNEERRGTYLYCGSADGVYP